MRTLPVVFLLACGSTATPAPSGTAPEPIGITTAPPPSVTTPPPAPTSANDVIVIKSSGAASRTGASPRVARRLVASRRGLVEFAKGYTEVGLTVTEVVSGSLYDPDYAKRPVGTNHLEVVLVDEAAYVAPLEMDGFAGTWKLTRLADDTLVASAIEDTPWPASTVAGRRAMIAQARKDLRSPLPEQRLAGLDALETHLFLELVPDVIALLDDTRSFGIETPPPGRGGNRVVGEVAEETLRHLVAPLADPAMPANGSADAWTAFWGARTTKLEPLMPVAPTAVTEHAKLPTYQSWPEFVPTPHGVVVSVSRLETPFDGNEDGVFVVRDGKRTWLSRVVPEALDAIAGAESTGVLYAEARSSWVFKLVGKGKPRDGSIIGDNANAIYNVLARSDTGFLVVGIDGSKNLHVLPLDGMGKPRGTTRSLALPAAPESSYHRGVQVLSVARRDGGWLAAIATKTGILVANFDESVRLVAAKQVSPAKGIVRPKIAVAGDRAFVAWANDRDAHGLETVVIDLMGKPISAIVKTSEQVTFVSPAVALDDGFAVAWIEGHDEVHLGRFNTAGERVANVIVQRKYAGPFALELERDKSALVVTYLDQTRYPFPLVSRRLEIAALK